MLLEEAGNLFSILLPAALCAALIVLITLGKYRNCQEERGGVHSRRPPCSLLFHELLSEAQIAKCLV